jgi:two-component system, chemotaxis family, protein-glutamate methylesterase/glutaminase
VIAEESRPQAIVVGASLGGMIAVEALLAGLPAGFLVPVLIAQHRGKEGGEALLKHLNDRVDVTIREPEDKEPIRPGYVYLAPADYHMLVDEGSIALSTDPPVNFARPSVDVLFDSAVDAYGSRLAGVILTGANSDGAEGLARIKLAGGIALVQEPRTAECAAMPSAAIAAARLDEEHILPVDQIAAFLARLHELCRR